MIDSDSLLVFFARGRPIAITNVETFRGDPSS